MSMVETIRKCGESLACRLGLESAAYQKAYLYATDHDLPDFLAKSFGHYYVRVSPQNIDLAFENWYTNA